MSSHYFGETSVVRVTEQCGISFAPDQLFAHWDPALLEQHRDLMIPTCFNEAEARFINSVHTWVVRTPKFVMLIDSCGGNHKNRPGMDQFHQQNLPFLERLAEAGVTPEEVDFVCCTHLHVDHCGWNTKLLDGRWVPTFPNARYIFSKAEHDHWEGPGREGIFAEIYEDSVLPVVASGQADIIDGDGPMDNGLILHSTPGHSPGHVSFELVDKARRGIFGGDIMHQPLQVYRPEWNTTFCQDQDQARASRRWLLEYAAEQQATVFTAHFAGSSAGLVGRKGDAFDWRFVP